MMSTSETEIEILETAMIALKAVYSVHRGSVSDRAFLKMISRASV